MSILFQPTNIFRYLTDTYEKLSGDLMRRIFEDYSPWTVAQQQTKLAESGQALSIASCRQIDLVPLTSRNHRMSWLPMLLSLGRRTMHVLNDFESIKHELLIGRNSARSEEYPIGLDTLIGSSENMLLCPKQDHTRLRLPFATPFDRQNINSREQEIAAQLLSCQGGALSDIVTSVLSQIDRKTLSQKEQMSSSTLLYAAASHTSSTTERYILELLMRYPELALEILQKWEETFGEINESYLGDQDEGKALAPLRLCTFINGGRYQNKDIKANVLVHAIMLETLRLYPAIPQIIRIAKQSFQINETSIQPGDVVILNIMGSQRDANVWQDPACFVPRRWITDDKINEDLRKKLLTFSYGSSACIGQHLISKWLLCFTTQQALRIGRQYQQTMSSYFLYYLSGGLKVKCEEFKPKETPIENLHTSPGYHITPPFLDLTSLD